ncbi:MAG: NADH-quinone oxidoreductase subunit A [Streptosporangiaceae bacterium]
MYNKLSFIYIILIIGFILFISKYLNKAKKNREKITVYECGFQEFDEIRKKYYLKFYLVAIIFLIFDLETFLLYPITIYITYLSNISYYIFLYYLYILCIGLILEINKYIVIY